MLFLYFLFLTHLHCPSHPPPPPLSLSLSLYVSLPVYCIEVLQSSHVPSAAVLLERIYGLPSQCSPQPYFHGNNNSALNGLGRVAHGLFLLRFMAVVDESGYLDVKHVMIFVFLCIRNGMCCSVSINLINKSIQQLGYNAPWLQYQPAGRSWVQLKNVCSFPV